MAEAVEQGELVEEGGAQDEALGAGEAARIQAAASVGDG